MKTSGEEGMFPRIVLPKVKADENEEKDTYPLQDEDDVYSLQVNALTLEDLRRCFSEHF